MAESEEISILEEIQRLLAGEPFAPFSIRMASGTSYEIGVGDYIAFGRSVITLVPYRTGRHILRSSQISEVNLFGDAK